MLLAGLKFSSNTGWGVRVVAIALALGLTGLQLAHGPDAGFAWSAVAGLPTPLRALLDPNVWLGQLSLAGYAGALWCTGGIFDAIRDRRPFEPRALRALTLTGLCLVAGATAGLFRFAIAYNDLARTSGFSIGFTLDDHTIPVGVIGAVFWLIARQGRRLKAELEQFV